MTNKRKLSDHQSAFTTPQGNPHQRMNRRSNSSDSSSPPGRPLTNNNNNNNNNNLRSPSEETVANIGLGNAFGKQPEVFARMPAAEYVLNPCGNLYVQLAVSNNFVRYLVLSESLRLASAVWSNLINPRSPTYRVKYRKLTASGGTVPFLDVQGDDPEALLCFLRIVHLDTEKVPRKLSFPQLRSIALLCEKYDCVKALGLWKEHWVDQFTLEHRLTPGYEDWLAVDAVFGNKNHFLQLMQAIVRESELGPSDGHGVRNLIRCSTTRSNGNGNAKNEPNSSPDRVMEVESKDCIPPEVMDEIRSLRQGMIDGLLATTRLFANHVLRGNPADADGSRGRYECTETCMAMSYGCYARTAERLDTLPLIYTSRFKRADLSKSPAEYYDKLKNIDFLVRSELTTRSEPRPCEYARRECGLKDIQADFSKALENAMRITANVDRYMKFREEKEWKWETINFPVPGSNESNLDLLQSPTPSTFENKMNDALKKKGL